MWYQIGSSFITQLLTNQPHILIFAVRFTNFPTFGYLNFSFVDPLTLQSKFLDTLLNILSLVISHPLLPTIQHQPFFFSLPLAICLSIFYLTQLICFYLYIHLHQKKNYG